MNKEIAEIPYTKFAYIFMLLNSLFCVLLFLSYVWNPALDFSTFNYSMENDPEGIFFFFYIIISMSICAFCLYFRKYKAALIFALLPEITFFLIVFFGLLFMQIM